MQRESFGIEFTYESKRLWKEGEKGRDIRGDRESGKNEGREKKEGGRGDGRDAGTSSEHSPATDPQVLPCPALVFFF